MSIMKQQLEQRLQQLKAEYESGQKVLADLDNRRAEVEQTLLRIQGAIQVLEEELAKVDEDANDNGNGAVAESNAVEVLATEAETEVLEASNGK